PAVIAGGSAHPVGELYPFRATLEARCQRRPESRSVVGMYQLGLALDGPCVGIKPEHVGKRRRDADLSTADGPFIVRHVECTDDAVEHAAGQRIHVRLSRQAGHGVPPPASTLPALRRTRGWRGGVGLHCGPSAHSAPSGSPRLGAWETSSNMFRGV